MKKNILRPLTMTLAVLLGTTACVSGGSFKKRNAEVDSQIAELKSAQEKTDQFVMNDKRLNEALEVGNRVDAIEKKVADMQRQLEDFQTTWDTALREYKSTLDTNIQTFEKINSQRNAKSNQLIQTAIQKQIDAVDALRGDLQKIQSELRVLAPETTGQDAK
ncbi:MAG TPA: hypothetical protein PKH51_02695 [Candidatus Sumerlaeota bacterium]|nr:hypothetical protein [Candidatus Sumerlaeota bacterium]HNM45902.1 hypothetical protein [Candidatus Sumerlaeota bacterium]